MPARAARRRAHHRSSRRAPTGLRGLLRRAPSPTPRTRRPAERSAALEAAGFRPVRILADREGYRFIEGLKRLSGSDAGSAPRRRSADSWTRAAKRRLPTPADLGLNSASQDRGKGFASVCATPMSSVSLTSSPLEEIARAAACRATPSMRSIAPASSGPFRARASSTPADAIRAGTEAACARPLPAASATADARIFARPTARRRSRERRAGFPRSCSSCVHAALVVRCCGVTSGAPESAPVVDDTAQPRAGVPREPGPGGGGGGGGLSNPLPPRKVEAPARLRRPRPASDASTRADLRQSAADRSADVRHLRPAPKPVDQEPLPSRRLVAPVVADGERGSNATASSSRHATRPTSQGSGVERRRRHRPGHRQRRRTRSGHRTGSGGGTGGGPYRAGSGVEPPRLLREVKARIHRRGAAARHHRRRRPRNRGDARRHGRRRVACCADSAPASTARGRGRAAMAVRSRAAAGRAGGRHRRSRGGIHAAVIMLTITLVSLVVAAASRIRRVAIDSPRAPACERARRVARRGDRRAAPPSRPRRPALDDPRATSFAQRRRSRPPVDADVRRARTLGRRGAGRC